MMKKLILTLSILCGITQTFFSQKQIKYEKLFYNNVEKQTNDVKIIVDNAVSTAGETKFKLKITNLTADFIILKPEECVFVVNGKEQRPKEKWLIIAPNESDFRVINLKGGAFNTIKNYSFKLNGLYKVSQKGTVVSVPNFVLPIAKNDFEASSISCTALNVNKETSKTEAKFKCVYAGDKVAIIQPRKAAAKLPDGKEYANEKKSDAVLLMKGQDETFTLKWERMEGGRAMDMQKVEMLIIWHETFTESQLQKLDAEELKLEFDEATTVAKNK